MKPKSENSAAGSSGSRGASGSTHANEGAAIYEELLGYYDSKIEMLCQTRDALEDTKPMLTTPNTPPADGDGDGDLEIAARQQQQRNRAFVSLELLADMVDDMAINIVFETFFEAKQAASASNAAENADSDAHSSQGAGSDLFECPSCERSFPVARFAAHMDKCMGLSSRRTATRRSIANSNGSTPSHVIASYDSSSEHSTDRKRKSANDVANNRTKTKRSR
ncbi:hypothetical protein H4217_002014 [Coemansia sp. RSA 1939]|nr:hypothetical protein H4217_002014 [Coemansia sp. RSA 1939]